MLAFGGGYGGADQSASDQRAAWEHEISALFGDVAGVGVGSAWAHQLQVHLDELCGIGGWSGLSEDADADWVGLVSGALAG